MFAPDFSYLVIEWMLKVIGAIAAVAAIVFLVAYFRVRLEKRKPACGFEVKLSTGRTPVPRERTEATGDMEGPEPR